MNSSLVSASVLRKAVKLKQDQKGNRFRSRDSSDASNNENCKMLYIIALTTITLFIMTDISTSTFHYQRYCTYTDSSLLLKFPSYLALVGKTRDRDMNMDNMTIILKSEQGLSVNVYIVKTS